VPTSAGVTAPKAAFSPPPPPQTTSASSTSVADPAALPAPIALPAPFSVDFADLLNQLGTTMGQALEDEHVDDTSGSCDLAQATTTGRAYVRCATGTSAFAALPDGLYHWAWLGDHLAAWIGPQADPPDMQTRLPLCVGPATGPDTACPLRWDLPVDGVLQAPDGTDTYRLDVTAPLTDAVIDLTDLPADYDLYLVDDSGTIVATSVQDDLQSEHIEQVLAPGSYFVYVHVDVSRQPDPTRPYTLQLTSSPPAPV
jgi:hypothetical protein